MISILNGVKQAKQDSLARLEYLATCLTTEVINFNNVYPATSIAGLYYEFNIECGGGVAGYGTGVLGLWGGNRTTKGEGKSKAVGDNK